MGILLSTAGVAADAEIEAKAYDVTTVRPSRSGRVYLFEKKENDLPVDGKLFLVREGETPVMAMRVLKTYSEKKRIAAKKLRTYPNFETLIPGSTFRAFEKTGDFVLPVPPTAEDINDLKDLENSEPISERPTEAVPDKPPVVFSEPSESSPEASPELKETGGEDSDDTNDRYFPNWFTMAIGALPNGAVPGPDPKLSGGFLYARNFSPSFAAETGFYYYKSSGDYNDSTVSMTIVPFIGNLRLQKKYGEILTGYVYGGFIFPFVMSEIGVTNPLLRKILVPSPALGVGAFLQTGPNWYVRFNLGVESITLGVMLRY